MTDKEWFDSLEIERRIIVLEMIMDFKKLGVSEAVALSEIRKRFANV
jgi:hypothetical protein